MCQQWRLLGFFVFVLAYETKRTQAKQQNLLELLIWKYNILNNKNCEPEITMPEACENKSTKKTSKPNSCSLKWSILDTIYSFQADIINSKVSGLEGEEVVKFKKM